MRGLPFNMKLTAPVDIVKNFEKHIQKKACKEVIPSVHPTLEEMQKLRNSLDYQKIRTMITSDYKLAPDFQQQMITYLRYVYLIDNYFKDDFTNPKSSLKIGFQWTDSFQPKKSKEISNIKFELVSCLYNLAVCYYTEAIAYINIANTQEKLKGIAKLRNALWCIDEIRQNLPSILVNPADIPSDLNPSYINLLFNYFIGLTYATLADITGTDGKKTGFEKVASIHKAASKHFQIAYNIIAPLKPCPIPDPHDKYLKMNLVYNTVMMRSEALMQMAQQHLQKVDEEVRKGHMGLAVSYLRLSKFDFEEVMKTKSDLEYMAPEQKTSFIERSKQIKALYDDCLLKNQRVYQQPEYTADQLAGIPEEKTSITPTEPRDIKKKLDAERAFEIFMAPEILRIKNEFINVVNNRMFEAENALKNANGVKNKLYSEAYVNYLLDLHSQAGGKKAEIPAQLKAKIDKFRKNGAVNAYHHTRQNLQDTSAACTKIIQEIKGSLSAEKLEDESLRQQYPGQWTRPYSEQCNQEYVLKLKDLEQKLYIAQNTDNDILKKFTQYQDWMQKLSLPDEQILTLIPKSNDPEFLVQVKDQIGELVGIDQMIRNLVDLDKQRANLIAMTEEFFNGDFISAFAAIHARSVDKQTEFIKLLGPYEAKLAKVTNDINEAYPLMDFISSQAKGIMGSRKDSNQPAVKILEEINLAITVLNDIFSDFQQALNFYNNLVVNLNALQKVVGDYCFAREIEKASLLQELQAQNNAGSMNASVNMNANAQPKLFDEEKLEFLMGNSQRMNQNRYPDAGAQFVNNQKQPQQQYPNYNPQAYSVPQNQGYPQMQPQPQNYAPVNQQHAQMYNQSNQGMNQQYSQPSFVPQQQQQQQQQQPQPQPQPQQMMKELTSFDQLGSMVESTYIKPSNRR